MATSNGIHTKARSLRILMLHGYTQSGPLFHAKTKALEKNLKKAFPAAPAKGHLEQYPGGVELHYPTGPIKLDYTQIPGYDVDGDHESPEAYGWWVRKDNGDSYTYEGMDRGIDAVAQVLRNDGPFDGAIGFSQGGAATGIVTSLLETGRKEAFDAAQARGGMPYPNSLVKKSDEGSEAIHPPLKFAVSYSGFAPSTNPLYRAFYEPKIATPMCHFIGSVDTVVEESRSLQLVDSCVDGKGKDGGVSRLIYHPGGHFLPSSQKQCVAALIAFIQESLKGGDVPATGKGEESVEDMDMPF